MTYRSVLYADAFRNQYGLSVYSISTGYRRVNLGGRVCLGEGVSHWPSWILCLRSLTRPPQGAHAPSLGGGLARDLGENAKGPIQGRLLT